MIETSNFEENSIFKKKYLNVGFKMSSKITRQEQRSTLNKINIVLSKLHDICSEDLYNTIINSSPKPYPTSTRI